MATCGKGSSGYKGKLYTSSDDGSTKTPIGSTRDMTMARNHSVIETTSFDSEDGYKDFIEGLKDTTISCESVYLETDVGQLDVVTAIDVGDTLILYYRPIDEVGRYEYVITVLVTSWEENNAVDDAAVVSAEFQGCGKPVRQIIS